MSVKQVVNKFNQKQLLNCVTKGNNANLNPNTKTVTNWSFKDQQHYSMWRGEWSNRHTDAVKGLHPTITNGMSIISVQTKCCMVKVLWSDKMTYLVTMKKGLTVWLKVRLLNPRIMPQLSNIVKVASWCGTTAFYEVTGTINN